MTQTLREEYREDLQAWLEDGLSRVKATQIPMHDFLASMLRKFAGVTIPVEDATHMLEDALEKVGIPQKRSPWFDRGGHWSGKSGIIYVEIDDASAEI